MQNSLNVQAFVVAGATSGIGMTLASALSKEGANTVLIARDKIKIGKHCQRIVTICIYCTIGRLK